MAYLEWFRTHPPDVGASIRAALAAAEAGIALTVATEELQSRTRRIAGNGSLMRVAPIGLRHFSQPERRARAARTDSKLTHYDDHAARTLARGCAT